MITPWLWLTSRPRNVTETAPPASHLRPATLPGFVEIDCMEDIMNVALWIIAGVLAVAYVASGGGKLALPKERIAAFGAHARWVEDFSPGTVKFIGTLEVLGAVGLILPALLDVAPILVPLAALGLVMIMAGAVITRVRRREFTFMVADLAYLVLAGFVAWGRFGPESFIG